MPEEKTELRNPTTIGNFLANCDPGQENVLDLIEQSDGSHKLAITSKQVEPDPVKMERTESPRRNHAFYSADDFGKYLKKYGGPDTIVLGDINDCLITAVLDDTASEGFERITCKPMIHPLFAGWNNLIEKTEKGEIIELDAFIDFVFRNKRTIIDPDAMELSHLLSQIKATTSLELHRGRGKDAVNGLLIHTKIQGEDKYDTIDLPESITIEMPIFLNQKSRKIVLDLQLETRANAPEKIFAFVTTADITQAIVDSFSDMFEEINASNEKNEWTIGQGTVMHKNWDYLEKYHPEKQR